MKVARLQPLNDIRIDNLPIPEIDALILIFKFTTITLTPR